MWFVIHVKAGTEAQAVELLRSAPRSDELDELFCPMAVILLNECGSVVERERPLLPGCVFAVASSKRALRACMRRAGGMEALYDRRPSFDVMGEGEERFINSFSKPGNRVVEMSEGVINQGRVVVKKGPLLGLEGRIRKYSRRKRRAYMDTSIAGEPVMAQVGLKVERDGLQFGGRCEREWEALAR